MTSPRAGAAYLALVTGAPVVPVSFLGTRMPGGSDGSIPPAGSRIAMTFGEPVQLGQPAVAAHAAGGGTRRPRPSPPAILQTMRSCRGDDRHDPARPAGPTKREKKRA